MNWQYRGILPAMQLPFADDLTIDEMELRRFSKWLAGHKGIGGWSPMVTPARCLL